jgi:hypothetical protein
VKAEPPVNVRSNGPDAPGSAVVALCATVMPEIAEAQFVLLVFVVFDVFCM